MRLHSVDNMAEDNCDARECSSMTDLVEPRKERETGLADLSFAPDLLSGLDRERGNQKHRQKFAIVSLG